MISYGIYAGKICQNTVAKTISSWNNSFYFFNSILLLVNQFIDY